jgi:hypothetical protein
MPAPRHQTVRLSACRHASPDEGVCVMELASMLAGEPFTDRPGSVSPSIAALLRGLNDGLNDEKRQTLKRFAAASVGTVADRRAERARRRLIGRSIGSAAHRRGPVAWASRALTGVDPYAASLETAHRIAVGDDELGDEVFALVDTLIAIGRDDACPAEPAELMAVSRGDVPAGRGR